MNVASAQLNNYDANGTAKPQAMGVRDRGYARDTRLLERGEIRQPKQVVPRGFVSIVNPDFRSYFNRRDSGRRQLAEWMVAPGNPLTSRVMVNRIWHHLFGQGLVRSMDNFGSTGEAPSHPELMDHLALRFTKNGWSIKKLLREIVISRTYRQASDYESANYNTNPDNRYLWRMSKRRLDAESIRDSMLSISGKLNTQMGGPSYKPFSISNFGSSFYKIKDQGVPLQTYLGVAGMPGRIIVSIMGIAVAMLSITGVVIWWKKRKARVAIKKRKREMTLSSATSQ